MKIGDRVEIVVSESLFSVFNNNTNIGTIIKEYPPVPSNTNNKMKKWEVHFDKPVAMCGGHMQTCIFSEDALKPLDWYDVVAYDKDADDEVSLLKTQDYDQALAHAMKFGEQCKNDLLLNPATGQPFDHVRLVNSNNWDVSYWASYEQ
jgi:hypothetical protein